MSTEENVEHPEHPEPLAQFATVGNCQVSLSRYEDGTILAHFRVNDLNPEDLGDITMTPDKRIAVRQASVKFDQLALASLREAITEHRWVHIQRERANEISLQCLCGLLWKHLPIKAGMGAELPRCPQEGQPDEENKLVRLLESLPETTERGFRYVEIPFRDYPSSPERNLSIQESSSATEHKLWVGFDTVSVDLMNDGKPDIMERGHLDADTVRKLRDTLTAWLDAD